MRRAIKPEFETVSEQQAAHAQQRSCLIKWGVFLEYTKIEQVKYKLFWQSLLFIHCYFIPRMETWDV